MLDKLYQPTFIGGDTERILPRCVPQLYRALLLELPDYVAAPESERSSLVFLNGNTLEIYPAERIKISAGTPVILADATAFIPKIYEAMFGRTADDVYAPTIRNPNAVISVVTGSDWTLGQIRKAVGRQLSERQQALSRSVKTMTGEEFDPSQVPVNIDLYGQSVVRDALTLIKGLAENHKSLVVVTHKTWREPLETTIKGAYPELFSRMAFGHYGALRGTNQYQHYEAIALIGMFRIPYDVIYRRAQIWMRHLDPTYHETIPLQTIIRDKPYHGKTEGHSYRTFDHWLADALVCLVEEGEMIQCVERIRPHATTERKYVYIFASRPFARFVSHLTAKKTLISYFVNARIQMCRTALQTAAAKEEPVPSVWELARQFRLSMPEAATIRAEFVSQNRWKTIDESAITQ